LVHLVHYYLMEFDELKTETTG